MTEDLFDRIRTLLRYSGPMKLQEILDNLDAPRKDVIKILEENHYTFEFTMEDCSKKWRLN